jgi:3'-phosphoadenosine 5'-phosphosulfate (PAPS) 3'-phosphatase
MTLEREWEQAVAIARRAGAEAQRMQGRIAQRSKADGSPVSDADLAADAIIRRDLTAAFPDDGILSEEFPDDRARLARRRVWLVDPIDGTRDYLAGASSWAVQIALAIDGTLALGVLDLPGHGVTLAGITGAGRRAALFDATGAEHPLERRPGGRDVLISSTSRRTQEAVARIRQALPEFSDLRATSVGVKVWRMLSGHADLYIHPRALAEWDVAAPAAVLAAAGGSATDLAGNPLVFNSAPGACPGLIFSTRADHAQLAVRLHAHGVSLTP